MALDTSTLRVVPVATMRRRRMVTSAALWMAVLAQHDANTEQRATGPRSSMPKMLENLVSHRHNFTDGPCYDKETRGHVYFKAGRHT